MAQTQYGYETPIAQIKRGLLRKCTLKSWMRSPEAANEEQTGLSDVGCSLESPPVCVLHDSLPANLCLIGGSIVFTWKAIQYE